jgi:hypothetical protein
MAEEERPKHYIYDCELGEEVAVPVSDEEWADIKRREAEETAQRQADAVKERELLDAIINHPDPVVQALARRVGMTPEGG